MLRQLLILVVVFTSMIVGGVAYADGWMHWPVDRATSSGAFITQGFYGDFISYCCQVGTNCRNGCGTHNGYDYGIGVGTPLYAVAPGVVDEVHATDTASTSYGRGGRWVRVRHDEARVPGLGEQTYYVAYLHMDTISVSSGDVVDTETVLGTSGNTGGVAAHLHLHVATDRGFCSAPVDPGCPTTDYVQGSVIPGFSGGSPCETACEDVPIMWRIPAQYGAEPYEDLCGELDFVGTCDGDLLRWCDGGVPNEVDCSESNRVCGHNSPEIGYDCLTCDELGTPRCEDERWLECEGEGTKATDCVAAGGACVDGSGCVVESADMGSLPDAGGEPDLGDAPDVRTSPDGGAGEADARRSPDADAADASADGEVIVARGCSCHTIASRSAGGGGLAGLFIAGLIWARLRCRRDARVDT